MLLQGFDEVKIQIKEKKNLLIVIFAIMISLLGIKASELSSIFILNHYPIRVIPDDFFFELIPYHLVYEYIVDLILLLMISISVYYIIKYAKEKLAYFWIVGWSYMVIRAFINILTSFDRPLSPDLLHGFIRLVDPTFIANYGFLQMGMFPSGHLGFATIAYIAVRSIAPKNVEHVMLLLLFLELIFIIASRGHYSIDVVGAIVFMTLFYLWAEKYVRKYLVMDK